MPVSIVFTTVSSLDEAETLAAKIVEQRLAACVQIVPAVTSVYFWEGEVRREEERMLLIKTLAEKFDALEAFIQANHSYGLPEIVGVEAEHISKPYLDWLTEYLR